MSFLLLAGNSASSAIPDVTVASDGQSQATSAEAPVSEFTDGQPQATSALAPVSKSTGLTTVSGISVRSSPSPTTGCATATFAYSTFSYTQETTNRYATPLPSPAPSKTYAPAFSVLSSLLPTGLTYTSYSLNPNATEPSQYGESAYAALWSSIKYSDTSFQFSTTAWPTPVSSSELACPPALYQPCVDSTSCFNGICLPPNFVWAVASSAWKIEGDLMLEGRGPSQLDLIGVLPQFATGGANDSVVTDLQYLLYKQGIARLAAIGILCYCFPISWTRIRLTHN